MRREGQSVLEGLRAGADEYLRLVERKRAEDARRESEGRYRILFECGPQPMWVYDLETFRFLAVNDAAVRHYGYTREEFLSITIKDIRPRAEAPALLEGVSSLPGCGYTPARDEARQERLRDHRGRGHRQRLPIRRAARAARTD